MDRKDVGTMIIDILKRGYDIQLSNSRLLIDLELSISGVPNAGSVITKDKLTEEELSNKVETLWKFIYADERSIREPTSEA